MASNPIPFANDPDPMPRSNRAKLANAGLRSGMAGARGSDHTSAKASDLLAAEGAAK